MALSNGENRHSNVITAATCLTSTITLHGETSGRKPSRGGGRSGRPAPRRDKTCQING